MKKIMLGILVTSMLIFTNTTIYGATTQIEVDGIGIVSDAAPQIKNNRTMVPLRIISENLGAKVDWSSGQATISKGDMQIILKPNSKEAIKNGQTELLDAITYVNNDRVMVPLRFIAETFGCEVDYKDHTVVITTEPLIINGIKVEALNYEFHMTMGGSISEIRVNSYNTAIYDIFLENQKDKVAAPIEYGWDSHIPDKIGAYYKNSQVNFKDAADKDVQEFGIYSRVNSFSEEDLKDYPKRLLHDVTLDKWYLLKEDDVRLIMQLINLARENGVLKEINNSIV